MTINEIQNIKTDSLISASDIKTMGLKEGEVIDGRVVDLRDTSISIAKNDSDEVLQFNTPKHLDLNVGDMVEVHVLKADVNSLQLSIKKIEEEVDKAESHNPVKDSVNMDELKKAIVESENPLKYSDQLDNHIAHAKSQVDEMLESFTDDEIKAIIKEGFDPGKMTVELLYQVGHSNRIDKKLAISEVDGEGVNVTVNDEKINQLIDEMADKHMLSEVDSEEMEAIAKLLSTNGRRVNVKNVDRVIKFADKVDKVKDMDSEDLVKFLSSDKKPSVGELYKSLYVSSGKVKNNVISEADYQAVEGEVRRIVEARFGDGEVESIMEIAKELVLKGVPLDERTVEVLDFVTSETSRQESFEVAVSALSRNQKPENVMVTDELISSRVMSREDFVQLKEMLGDVQRADVENVLLRNRQVTFRELEFAAQERVEMGLGDVTGSGDLNVVDGGLSGASEGNAGAVLGTPAVISDAVAAEITLETGESGGVTSEQRVLVDEAVYDLQVVRYEMTFKAAMSLSIRGVDLMDTAVSEIRQQLEMMSVEHVDENVPVDSVMNTSGSSDSAGFSEGNSGGVSVLQGDESVVLSKHQRAVLEVKEHMAVISSGSRDVLGQVALDQDAPSLSSVSQAMKAYDEGRTEVRADLGDRIEKAFGNIDEILVDLKLEPTENNHRVVEILARNEMEITLENINQVKTLDVSLNELFNKMMPEHVKELVDNQVDVVQMPIDELTQFVREKDALLQVNTSEQVAKQILGMSKNGELTEEERQGMVGFYRMVHTIESSKGAAVGFMVNNDMPVTVENLFDVAKVIGDNLGTRSGTDVVVDDAFGELEKIELDKMTIKEQVRLGYLDKAEAVDRVIEGGFSGGLGSGGEGSDSGASGGESGSMANSGFVNAGEVVGNRDYVDDMELDDEVKAVRDLLEAFVKMDKGVVKKGAGFSEGLSLNDWNTLGKVEGDGKAFVNGLELLQDVFGDSEEMLEEIGDSLREASSKFLDNPTVAGRKEFEGAVRKILDQARAVELEKVFAETSTIDERSSGSGNGAGGNGFEVAKEVQSQLNVQQRLAEDDGYYTMPVMINGEMQQMNMYYFRQAENTSRGSDEMSVYFSFSTKNMGTANMKVDLAGDRVGMTMYATEDVGNRQMKAYEDDFKEVLGEVGLAVDSVSYETFKFPKPVEKEDTGQVAKKVNKYSSLFEQMA